MGDVLTFTLRPRPSDPPALEPLSDGQIRAQIDEAAQVAVDAAERLIAILDRMDGDPDLEDGADAEPSLAAPENHHDAQVTWLRGNDADREAEAAEIALPEVVVPPLPAEPEPWPLPWSGRGNVITACGAVILALAGG